MPTVKSIQLTMQQFYRLCQDNTDLKFERNSNGDLIIMPPVGGNAGNRNGRIIQQLFNWADRDGTGIAFDSSTGFVLPNGANRSPDAAWIPLKRWNALQPQQQDRLIPLCPDFVVELLYPINAMATIREIREITQKMQEYIDNGTQLGWLINLKSQEVEIYRQSRRVDIIDSPTTLSGENILPGFALQLDRIW